MTDPATEPIVRRPVSWAIPADGEHHPIGTGPVLHTDTSPWGFGVRIWTEQPGQAEPATEERLAIVIADDQPIPDGHTHLGSTTTKNGAWHIYATATITPEEPA